jgi:hypothetical protein
VQGRPEDLLLDALHVLAVAHQIGQLEQPELVGDRRHDGGGQREMNGAEAQLLQAAPESLPSWLE